MPSKTSALNIAFLNVCSLRYKVHDVKAVLASQSLDILGVAETWLDQTIGDGELCIPGYSIARRDRGRQGGGVAIYYRSTLPARPRPDLSKENVEIIWLEVKSKSGPHLVACVYRPPNEPVAYWTRIEQELERASQVTPSMTLLGEFNAKVCQGSHQVRHLLDLCDVYGLKNHVISPTRVTPEHPHGTVIDLVLSDPTNVSACSVIPCDISDHFLVRAHLHLLTAQTTSRAPRITRHLHRMDFESFRRDLIAANLYAFAPGSDVHQMWHQWHGGFMDVLDRHAPQILTSQGKRPSNPPWSDRDLFQLNQRKIRLHKKWLANKGDWAAHQDFKRARSACSNAYRRKRNEYFRTQCSENNSNPRQMWSVINQVTGRSRQHQEPACPMDAVTTAFHKVITDTSRPQSLQIPSGPPPQQCLISFPLVTVREVERLLRSINTTKATGSDDIPGFVLKKHSADILAPSLVTLFNASLSSGEVPRGFKLAHVTPLFKAGDPSVPTNYRPVSLLPVISKLLEKLVQKALVDFVDPALPNTQFAFRPGHSTEDALALLSDTVLQA
eukprot:scpid74239/ scgid15537/ RNA-directed DNA polymerase from mobile element jockey; Reverse transcriptase